MEFKPDFTVYCITTLVKTEISSAMSYGEVFGGLFKCGYFLSLRFFCRGSFGRIWEHGWLLRAFHKLRAAIIMFSGKIDGHSKKSSLPSCPMRVYFGLGD
jgi:hypothetical protein